MFKIINDTKDINLTKKWVTPTKFNSKYRIVDARGNKIGSDYKGKKYEIIEKRERQFSFLERFGRGFLGTLAVICTLGLILFSKFAKNLFIKSKETIRFGVKYDFLTSPSAGLIDIEKEAPRFFFKENEQHIVKKFNDLMDDDVYNTLTSECDQRYLIGGNIVNKGFTYLKCTILEHEELDNWIVKGGGKKRSSWIRNDLGKSSPNNYDSIMRVFMAERISKVIEEEKLVIVVPEERLLLNEKKTKGDLHEKYHVFSKKLDILNNEDTINHLNSLDENQQRKIAKDICQLIKKTGFMDAHFDNIRWSPSLKKIAIIDTESQGLLAEINDSEAQMTTIEKCALIGLQEFYDHTLNSAISRFFFEEAQNAINRKF